MKNLKKSCRKGKQTRRNLLFWNRKAVSPIVGTLMLVLITVGAASSFAIFTGQQQGRYQQQQEINQFRELENISITHIKTINYDPVADTLTNVSFQIKPMHLFTSNISEISINNIPINFFTVILQNNTTIKYYSSSYNPQKAYSYEPYLIINETGVEIFNITIPNDSNDNYTDSLVFKPDEIYTICLKSSETLDINISNHVVHIPNTLPEIHNGNTITLDINTRLANHFHKSFIAPNPIGMLEYQPQYNGTGYEQAILLDGTRSHTRTENSYLIEYLWNVTYDYRDQSFYYINNDTNSEYNISFDFIIQDSHKNYSAAYDSGNNTVFIYNDINGNNTYDNETEYIENITYFPIPPYDPNNLKSDVSKNILYYEDYDCMTCDYYGSKTIIPPSISENLSGISLRVTDNQGMCATTQIYP